MKYFWMIVYDLDSLRESIQIAIMGSLAAFVFAFAWGFGESRSRWEARNLPMLQAIKMQPRDLPECDYFDPTKYAGFASRLSRVRC